MLVYGRSKYIIAALVLLLSVLYSMPNLYPQDPSVQITPNRGAKVDAAFEQRMETALKAAGIAPKKVEVQKGGELLVRLPSPDAQIKASDVLREAAGSNYVVALNLASTVPDWLRAVGARPMLLGLDLQGGVHFLMQVDQKAALEKRFESYAEDIRVLLRENRVRYESVERRPDSSTVPIGRRSTSPLMCSDSSAWAPAASGPLHKGGSAAASVGPNRDATGV